MMLCVGAAAADDDDGDDVYIKRCGRRCLRITPD